VTAPCAQAATSGGHAPAERWLALAGVLAGLLAATALSPRDAGLRTFVANLVYSWGPQALVVGVLLAFRPRPAVIAGASLAMALHLVAFASWARTLPPREALAWLYYLFSFPGALVGACAAAVLSRLRRPRAPAPRAGLVAAGLTLVGIVLNHLATVLTAGFGL
jgi:hypothetical protein